MTIPLLCFSFGFCSPHAKPYHGRNWMKQHQTQCLPLLLAVKVDEYLWGGLTSQIIICFCYFYKYVAKMSCSTAGQYIYIYILTCCWTTHFWSLGIIVIKKFIFCSKLGWENCFNTLSMHAASLLHLRLSIQSKNLNIEIL